MIRTFISIDVPVTDRITEVLDEMKGADNIKPVPKGQIHLTLKFLGDQDERKVDRLCSSLRDALAGTEPFEIVIEGVGAFPDRKHPRVVWLGVREPDALIKAADIVDSAVKGLRLKCDDKSFSPHMTVGRVSGIADLKGFFERYGKKTFCSFTCDHIDVMKSVLTPKGAIHSMIERIDL